MYQFKQRFYHEKRKTIHGGKKTVSWNVTACIINPQTQVRTLDYMKGDLGRSTQTNRLVPIAQDQTNTLLSCPKSTDKVKLLNFKPTYIKVNDEALKEAN